MRPRKLVPRGHVPASGLLIARSGLGEAEARRRVLALWRPGLVVRALEGDWLVELPRVERLPAGRAFGLPLVRSGGRWLGLPEGEGTGALPGTVVLARAGAREERVPGETVDPASWLELDAFETVNLEPLAPPPPAVEEPESVAVRAADYRVPEPGPEAEALQQALAEPEAPRWWLRALQGVLARLPDTPHPTQTSGTAGARGPSRDPAPPSWWQRLLRGLRLDLLLGRRTARLVQELIDQLEGGDLEQALRRAIPLGGEALPGGGFSLPSGLPFRDALTVGPRGGGAGGGLSVGPSLYELLQQTYEQVARRLERAGRIEEAAYVLAELLDRADAAVRLCEAHERWALAARIAEVRGLEVERVIRLWVLAEEVERATDLARLSGAWAPALYRVEADHPELARGLRVRWSLELGRAGRYRAAVDLLEPVGEGARERLGELAEAGVLAGGDSAGELAVRRLQWGPSDAASEHLEALLRDRSEARRVEGRAAIRTLARVHLSVRWVRLGLRALLDDPVLRVDADLRRTLLGRARDPLLARDLPDTAPPEPPTFLGGGLREVGLAAVGSGARVHALARGADGSVAVGLGEVGLRILGPDGSLRHHLDPPVRALVPLAERTTVLALEHVRGEARAWRVDLRRGLVRPWGVLQLGCFARRPVGGLWAVADGERLRLLDVDAERPRALWSVALRRATSLWSEGDVLHALAESEHWRWRRSGADLVLRHRAPLERPETAVAVGPGGRVGRLLPEIPAVTLAEGPGVDLDRALAMGGVELVDLFPAGDGWYLAWEDEGLAAVDRIEPGRPPTLSLRLTGHASLTAFDADEAGRWLLLGTDDGQVVHLDLRTGRRVELRLG